jgi:hypothetical protein
MSKIITDLDDAIAYINTLYNGSSTPPASGEEDYEVWLSLLNIAISLWENEEGMTWKQLFVKLTDASDGDKTTTAGDYSYATPSNFVFPASGFVWLGTGTNKTAFKVRKQEDVQLYENDPGNWCYFLQDTTPTLEFNPNCQLTTGAVINYNYYKTATALTTGASTFDMADPMFAVYYALSELKKEEGDTSPLVIANSKLEAMRVRNMGGAWHQEEALLDRSGGFGI